MQALDRLTTKALGDSMSNMEATQLFGEEHVRRYRETDGDVGHIWKEGSTILLLTTTGRATGRETTTPLIYNLDGDTPVIVASKARRARPSRLVQESRQDAGGRRRRSRAIASRPEPASQKTRSASGCWELMTEIWPHYDEYATKTGREIPVVVLERIR